MKFRALEQIISTRMYLRIVEQDMKLRFFAANRTRMLSVRNLSVTMKKTSGMTMKTLEGILAVDDGKSDKGGKVRPLHGRLRFQILFDL